MKKDLPTAPKPDPENSLIRALRMVAAHFRKQADEFQAAGFEATAADRRGLARQCTEEMRGEIEQMRKDLAPVKEQK